MGQKETKRMNIYLSVDMHDWIRSKSKELNVPMSSLVIMAVHEFRRGEELSYHYKSIDE